MPASYATPQDLAQLMRRDINTAYAELLLAKASRMLRAAYPWLDARIAAGTFDPLLAADVVTEMAKRALLGADATGLKSESLDGISVSYENAMQNLWLTAADRALLTGPVGTGVGSMRLRPGWTVPTTEWR